MKKFFSVFLLSLITIEISANPLPFSHRSGQVTLRLENNIQLIIDERVELVCTVFRLAGAREFANYQQLDYVTEVDDFVQDFKSHPIVPFIREIREKYNFAYTIAAKSALMVKIVDDSIVFDKTWDIKKTFKGEYEQCWTEEIFREYVRLLDDFYKTSGFHLFFIGHIQYYKDIVSESAKAVSGINVPLLEQFFQKQMFPIDLYIGVSMGNNNYCIPGVKDQKHWNKHVAIVIGVLNEKNNIPSIMEDQIYTIVHEISHFFVAPLFDKKYHLISSEAEAVFTKIKDRMSPLGYGNARSVAGEWINELYTLHYFLAAGNTCHMEGYIANNEERGYIWIGKSVNEIFLERKEENAKQTLSEIILFAKSLPDRWDTIQAEYLDKKPYIVEVRPSFEEVTSQTKVIRIVFSESMTEGMSGMFKLADHPMIPADFPSCHWENDTTFVIILNADMLVPETEYGVRLPFTSFVSAKHYRMKDNFDVVFKVH